jgi:putative CocE/NonD family hydrolase
MSLLDRRMLKRLGLTATHEVQKQPGIKVPMADGAELLTDLYLGDAAGAPVILLRSPYGRSVVSGGALYAMASQGYNVVVQSCRGTFGSSGIFDPHHDEQRDGLATLEWIKRQPWYGGAIATYGGSYLAYTQWAIAATTDPALKAMAMQVTLSDFAQMTYAGNSLMLENAFSWTHMMSAMKKGLLSFIVKRVFGRLTISDAQWQTLPLANMDEKIIGERVGFWQDWMQHDCVDDPWWKPLSFRHVPATLTRPISMVAGWYDIFLPWQMRDFIDLQKASGNARITIGPWRHADLELRNFGVVDAIDWFNQHLLGKKPPAPQQPVKLFVQGVDEWRAFDQWPPRESVNQHWHLQPQHQLRAEIAPESAADIYRYDPADPTPSLGGPSLDATPFSVDNASLEARADVLTYTSDALAQPMDIIGPVAAELYVSSSSPSADFFVRLCVVDAAGVSKNISDGLQRVAINAPISLEEKTAPQCVRIELWPTAYRFAAGQRIRVQISSGAFPRWARNAGSGEAIASTTKLYSATQSIHHSPAYPSAIILPLCQAAR